MSKISDVYDALQTAVATLLPTYIRLPNPYDPDFNPNLSMEKGFGIGLSPAVNSERLLGCQVSIERVFNVILVNQIHSFDNDAEKLGDLEKSIMEDQYKLVEALEKDATINSERNTVKYQSDGGIEFLVPKEENIRSRYFLVESSFVAEYFQPI